MRQKVHALACRWMTPSAHPTHKMFATVDNVAGKTGIANTGNGYALRLVTSLQSINTDKVSVNVTASNIKTVQCYMLSLICSNVLHCHLMKAKALLFIAD